MILSNCIFCVCVCVYVAIKSGRAEKCVHMCRCTFVVTVLFLNLPASCKELANAFYEQRGHDTFAIIQLELKIIQARRANSILCNQ